MELVSKTLHLLEKRVMTCEDKMQHVTDYIKYNDLTYEPPIVSQVQHHTKFDASNPITQEILAKKL